MDCDPDQQLETGLWIKSIETEVVQVDKRTLNLLSINHVFHDGE